MISIREVIHRGCCPSGSRQSHRGTSFLTTPQQRLAIASLVVLLAYRSCANPEDHVCFRYESYTELEMVPRNQTVQVLTREWCLEIPPRCTSYRPEIKEVYVKQNVTKTRKIEYCCEGYEQIHPEEVTNNKSSTIAPNSTISTNTVTPTALSCRPVCRGGCGRGLCESPNGCSCEAGYTGKHCTQRCRNGTWGENCKHRCHCQNFSLCESKTGHCRCTDGWIGNHCETPCPSGFYGILCKNQCNCNTSRCDPASGRCLVDDGHVMFENITRIMERDYSGESTERISLSQWVKVDSTSSSTTPQVTTAHQIDLINSSYAKSYQEYLPLNTNITLIPIENITTTTEEVSNDTVYEMVASTTRLEITFIDASVKSVSSGSSTTEGSNANKGPELVFVDDRTNLVEYVEDKNSSNEETDEEVNHTQAVVTISSLLLALVLLLSVVAYMKKINRQTMMKQQQMLHQHQRQMSVNAERGPDSPRILEPLPDIPKVIYTKVKGKNQRDGSAQLEHYDVPVNNSSVNKSSPYNYNFTLSKPPPGHHLPPRKYSLEHIYDEIHYPPMEDLNGSTTMMTAPGGNGAEDHFSKSIIADTKMTPVKIIDEIKGKQ